jgi:hypothetical protein
MIYVQIMHSLPNKRLTKETEHKPPEMKKCSRKFYVSLSEDQINELRK